MADDLAVVIGFVIPKGKTEVTVTQAMALAYDKSKDAGLSTIWIQEQEMLNLKPTKEDVLVLDPFSGAAFNHVTNFPCSVLGPSVLLSCLATNSPVPELPYPVYNTSMKGMIITVSGMEQSEKKRLKQMVERMAGIHSNAFHDGVTHLVTATTRSQKYEVAVEKEIPCMLPKWVDEVWSVSNNELVTAVDPRFSIHRCPALFGVTVSVSQLNRADKDLLRRTVEMNGGVYSGVLEMETTTVLVCTSPDGDKYNHAKKWNIPCVTSQWVFDCIEKGFCLQTNSYRVSKGKSSISMNPLQDQTIEEVNVMNSTTTTNQDETMGRDQVDETINCSIMGMDDRQVVSKTTGDWLAELELSKVKKAGSFLDGCKVFLSGFTEPEQMQLARVLKYSGGVRLTQLVESVTHCVHSVGTSTVVPDTSKMLEQLDLSPHMVSIQWVVESMVLGKPVPEAEYPFPPQLETETETILPPQDTQLQASYQQETAGADQSQFEANLLAEYGM